MVAINKKFRFNSGDNNPPEINIDSNLRRWFSRNIGLWKSNRAYFLEEDKKNFNLCMYIKIEPLETKNHWESHYKFTWYPEKKYSFFKEYPKYKEKGEMKAFIKGHQLIFKVFLI